MQVELFSQSLEYPLGLPLGGFGRGYKGVKSEDSLQINGIAWVGDANEKQELISIDALYPGALKTRLGLNTIIAASHTHFSPMLDNDKPQLGEYFDEHASYWEDAYLQAPRSRVSVDSVDVFSSDSSLPVYRRMDAEGGLKDLIFNRFAGMYPNELEPVDKSIRLYLFKSGAQAQFGIIWHCCHPVSRSDRNLYSPDYIGSLRRGLKQRFGDVPLLFFLGPSGDIRPKLIAKRFSCVPGFWWNRRFKKSPDDMDQVAIDDLYFKCAQDLTKKFSFTIDKIASEKNEINVVGTENVIVKKIIFTDDVSFSFIPFEVSHRYHHKNADNHHLLVSCAENVIGYLPHKSQLKFGGYEVDGSRALMGMKNRVFIKHSDLSK